MKPNLVALADAWDAEAKMMRRRIDNNPVAATLDSCAAELREALATAAAEDRSLSTQEYADLSRVTPQAVTQWIAAGELEAYRDGKGHWRIPASAARKKSA